MITRISKQGGRRYSNFRSTMSTDARPLSTIGPSSSPSFTPKIRKNMSILGGRIGVRQPIGGV